MKLHLGIRILCNKNLIAINENVLFAQHLLDSFVAEGNLLYDNFVVYNVHGLLHITEYVENFGTLDQYSAFQPSVLFVTTRPLGARYPCSAHKITASDSSTYFEK